MMLPLKCLALNFAVGEVFDFDFYINSSDYSESSDYSSAKLTINGVEYTTANGLIVTTSFDNDAFGFVICPPSDMLSQSGFYSANYQMDYINYDFNAVNKAFDFNFNSLQSSDNSITMTTTKTDIWSGVNLPSGYINITG